MSNLPQIRRIYTNVLLKVAETVKYDYRHSVKMSYYKINEMNETELLNNLEKLTSKLSVVNVNSYGDYVRNNMGTTSDNRNNALRMFLNSTRNTPN